MSRSFTLIEVLAVVVVLSLIAAVSVSSLGNVDTGMQVERAGARLRDLDTRARIYARRHEAVRLLLGAAGSGVAVLPLDSEETILSIEWPPELSVTLAPVRTDSEMVIDRRGCGPDYRVSVTDGRTTLSWSVLGLTGAIIEKDG